MAFTEQSLAATEAYRLTQVGVATQVDLGVASLMSLVTLDDLSGSWGDMEEALVVLIRDRRRFSVQLTEDAYRLIRQLEDIPGRATPRGPGKLDVDNLRRNLRIIGPGQAGKSLAEGMPEGDVLRNMQSKLSGEAQRVSLNGGRFSMHNSVLADKQCIGWVRVTDGNPCAFCRLLASRGPVYKTEADAVATRAKFGKGRTRKDGKSDKRSRGEPGGKAPGIWSDRVNGFRAHAHCGCTARPIYSKRDPLLDRSKQFLAEYNKAVLARPDLDPINAYRTWLRVNGSPVPV